MVQTVSLSTRVTPQVRERLAAEASARGVALATYTRELLSVPANPGRGHAPGDDAVQNEVRCLFTHLPDDAGLAREVCLALARTVEMGGTAGISAAKALLEETDRARMRYAFEDDAEDED